MIYLDNTTTTKMDERLTEIMEKYHTQDYGIAISDYSPSFSMKSREVIKETQKIISERINCAPEEIVFTSGQAESNNQILKGIKKGHIITSKIEHSSILQACKNMEKEGYKITYLKVNDKGLINLDQLKKNIEENTILVSIQHANQEVGTIQEIQKIGKICKHKKLMFHVDASQSFLKEKIDVKEMGIDFLTITSNLIHGPKGIGSLYIKKGTKIRPIIDGTRIMNISAIAGFGKAIQLWDNKDNQKMRKQKEKLIQEFEKIPNIIIYTPKKKSLPNIISLGFKFIEGESIVLYLDSEGIILSTGSACAGQGLKPSHVLEAMGYGEEDSHGSIRIGLSKFTTDEQIDITVKKLKKVVEKLRKMSPIKGE
jgi:cysteine desulfurase